MTEKEPTLEQVGKDLLEFAGLEDCGEYGWRLPGKDLGIIEPNPISLDWLAKWCWPKLGEPIVSISKLTEGHLAGQFSCELDWADMSHHSQVGYGSTRSEAAARATWKAIQESSRP